VLPPKSDIRAQDFDAAQRAGSRTRERRDPRGNTARQCLGLGLGLLAKIVVQVAPVQRLSLTRRSLLTSRRMLTDGADFYVRVSGNFSRRLSDHKTLVVA
jgi:hypothetical protein